MMKKQSLLSLLLAVCLCMMIAVPALATEFKQYSIDTPYEYPVVPGTAEWGELRGQVEKVNVCQIPEEILSEMTTEALFETVLNYPLRSNMYVYNDVLTGYNAVKEQFNGLQELATRDDLEEVLADYYSTSLHSTEEDDGTLKQCFGQLLYRIFTEDNV